MKFCTKCGKQCEDDDRFCMGCGGQFQTAETLAPADTAVPVAADVPAVAAPAAVEPVVTDPASIPAVEPVAPAPPVVQDIPPAAPVAPYAPPAPQAYTAPPVQTDYAAQPAVQTPAPAQPTAYTAQPAPVQAPVVQAPYPQQPAGGAPAMQQPYYPQPAGMAVPVKKKRSPAVIILPIVAIVVVAAVVVCLLLFFNSSSGASSAKAAAEDYIRGSMTYDADKVAPVMAEPMRKQMLKSTKYYFTDEDNVDTDFDVMDDKAFTRYVKAYLNKLMEKNSDAYAEETDVRITAFSAADETTYKKGSDEFETNYTKYKSQFSNPDDIQEFAEMTCTVSYVKGEDDEDEDEVDALCVKIGGRWYVLSGD